MTVLDADEADRVVREVHDPLRIWQQLPPEISQRIIGFLPRNEVACTVRLVNKAAAALFRGPRYATVRLSQPVPPHAFLRRWDVPHAARCLTLKQRRQLLRLTARSGCIANLEVVIQRLGCPLTTSLLAAAASAEQKATCLWLRDHGCRWSEAVMRVAAATGNAPFCAWLIDAGCPFDERALTAAAAAGHAAVCELLVARGCTWHAVAASAAATGGHVDLLDWLLACRPASVGAAFESVLAAVATGCDFPTLQRLHAQLLSPAPPPHGGGNVHDDDDDWAPPPHPPPPSAFLHDHLRVRHVSAAIGSATPDWRAKVEWLLAQGFPLTVDCWRAAASRPDWLERLDWLQQKGLQLDVRAALAAARAGRVDALLYLMAQGVRLGGFESMLATEAAGSGHLYVLQALAERDVRWDVGVSLQHAAASGHTHVVKWLLETFAGGGADGPAGGDGGGGEGGGGGGGDGGEDAQRLMQEAATVAAGAGSLELLTWLYDRGCRFHEQTFAVAAEWGSEEMLEWLVDKGCPMGDSGEPYVRAAQIGDLATLRCLRSLGCPWDPRGATFTRAVAQGCSRRVLQWLHEQGCPVNWAAAWREALRPWRKEVEVVDWIRVQRRQAGLLTGPCLRLQQRLGLRMRLGLPEWCGCAAQLAADQVRRLRERLAALTSRRG
ncbi:hypothetical protein PLESTB_001655000 [Pleodorina starrii]|uniref:Ankyrin repeat domain-containing protein n=1 Tax=Pleodorina starrii TaxID=330485 RepID=A0A9W6F9H9_9CHLO|nr:hypothetical protein PLESTB_001655000 [Pleodorina starrii]GLC70230.1 hypothetical protein PLESTF_000944800 [Pleodorina starrii]